MKPITLAWHYTTGVHFVQIAESGFLCPATAGIKPPEKAILWFSLDQHFEPTALKGSLENGAIRTLSMQETFDRGGGLIRFGISPHRLLAGEKLRTRARVDRNIWSALRSCGIEQKADPDLWLGSISPMAIQHFTIDVMDSNGIWKRVQGLASEDMKGGVNGCRHRRKYGGKGIRQESASARHGVLEGARRASANTPWRAAPVIWVS